MSGHYGPEVGSAMEDEFNLLLERLGYRILRKRNPEPPLDFVAKFVGQPIFDSQKFASFASSVTMLSPIFAPEGVTAFSVKKGDVGNSEVQELIEDVEEAKESGDNTLTSIQGQVIVTNYTKTEAALDEMLRRQVFCWDIRRLIFYASKARMVQQRAAHGPLKEYAFDNGQVKGTYLAQPNGLIDTHTLDVVTNVFLDDHSTAFLLASDHMSRILDEIYVKTLAPITNDTGYDLLVTISVYVLGLANSDVVKKAFIDYAAETGRHPKVSFAAQPGLQLFQFGAAPWTVLLRA